MAILIIAKAAYILCLSWVMAKWMDSCTCSPNLKSYIEALPWLSHIYHAGIFNITSLSRVCVFGANQPLGAGKVNRTHILRTGEGQAASECPGLAQELTDSHIFLVMFPNNTVACYKKYNM